MGVVMAKLPGFMFYPGDWLKEPSLRRCSHAAKGVYIDILCLMFECDERGVLSTAGRAWGDQEVARAIGGQYDVTLACIQELADLGVVSRSTTGALYCRRMVRDENKRKLCSDAGKRGGGNPKVIAKVTTKVRPMAHLNMKVKMKLQMKLLRKIRLIVFGVCIRERLESETRGERGIKQ
jgi:hypothetical protein